MLALLLAMAATDIDRAIENAVDPCRGERLNDAIVVCGRSKEENDRRFRLPPEDRGFDPFGTVDSVSRERQRLLDGDGASQDLTRGSCSAVGASGSTGCMIKTWREHDQQRGR